MTDDRPVLGTMMMLAFCLTAPLIDTAAKLASDAIPVGQITAARYVAQALILVPVMVIMRLDFRIDRAAIWLTFLRAALSVAATLTFVGAIAVMPLADALAIVFVEPFLLLLIGHFILAETVGIRRLGAAVVGFVGSLIIIRPSFAEFGAVALLPLGTALFFTFYMISMRWRTRGAHPVSLQAMTAVAAMVLTVPLLWLADGSGLRDFDPVMPQGRYWAYLFAVGVAASVAHLLLTYALRFASSTVLAPLHYLELISATFFGYVVFSDFPDLPTWIGITVIAASGIYIIHRERVTAHSFAPGVASVGPPP
ncbi:MAG: DMT family transporter [Paracoccaceae bacterium]